MILVIFHHNLISHHEIYLCLSFVIEDTYVYLWLLQLYKKIWVAS